MGEHAAVDNVAIHCGEREQRQPLVDRDGPRGNVLRRVPIVAAEDHGEAENGNEHGNEHGERSGND